MFAPAFPVTPRSSLPLDIQSPAPPLAGFSRLAWLWVPHTAIPCWKTVVSPTPIYTATPINYPCINLVLCYNVDGKKPGRKVFACSPNSLATKPEQDISWIALQILLVGNSFVMRTYACVAK